MEYQIRGRECSEIVREIVEYLKKYALAARVNGMLVGISGGIDSAVVAHLIKLAFPDDSMGVLLPCHSSENDIFDGMKVVNQINLSHRIIDISEEHTLLLKRIRESSESKIDKLDGMDITDGLDDKLSLELQNAQEILEKQEEELQNKKWRLIDANLRARLRMSVLYAVAGEKNYLVVGTDNAAEILTGYYTKYGDGGVDILPLAPFLKREIYILAKYLGVSNSIIEKKPSAGLWDSQTDEDEMGTTYEMIDDYIEGKEIPEKDKEIIERLHRISHHKRNMPPQWRIDG